MQMCSPEKLAHHKSRQHACVPAREICTSLRRGVCVCVAPNFHRMMQCKCDVSRRVCIVSFAMSIIFMQCL